MWKQPILQTKTMNMSKKTGIIILFVVLAFLAAFIVWKYTFRKSETNAASKKTDFYLDASTLLQEYENNEDSANIRYLDKVIVVTGIVESITRDSLSVSLYLKQKDAISGVICSFDRNALDPVTIQAGTTVKVKGICAGYLMDVVINKCSLEKQ